MSYQVLARKWRPRCFNDMIGQQHVVRALSNALDHDRLHHAYLFAGSSGIGKTTVARIFAKCLNCQQGIRSQPCDQCTNCQEVDQGRFIDLLEVDAASRTKVEDTRELLDNVQYLPTHGRFKIYLIDEVHMLSGHSFNALLKTLEEPPAHVKFLLATTDPQRLPVTVLTRCLQFNLKKMAPEAIAEHLKNILIQEQIHYEDRALQQLGHAANGSIRDALSLLDQAIAYGAGQVREVDVCAFLGTIEQSHLYQLLAALAENNAQTLFATIAQLAEQGVDFTQALEELLSLLHNIALAQVLSQAPLTLTADREKTLALAKRILPEDIQLYYQIGLIGQRDLPLAPSARSGFEMVLLRMLAFRPQTSSQPIHTTTQAHAILPTESSKSLIQPEEKTSSTQQDWPILLSKLNLTGLSLTLAQHCALKTLDNEQIHLQLESTQAALLSDTQQERIMQAFNQYFAKPMKLRITIAETPLTTPASLAKEKQQHQQQKAIQTIETDPNVQTFLKIFNAQIQSSRVC